MILLDQLNLASELVIFIGFAIVSWLLCALIIYFGGDRAKVANVWKWTVGAILFFWIFGLIMRLIEP